MLIHLRKTGLSNLLHLKHSNLMITLVYLVSVLVNSWSNKPKENYGTPV